VLTLPNTIRKMISLPAHTFGPKDRARARESFDANLGLFHPAKVPIKAGLNQPHQYTTGLNLVPANGAIAVYSAPPNTLRQGRVLRHQ
jgi:N-acyl-D-aspartate/D-glutamate deacylase